MADRAKFTDWLIAKELVGGTPRPVYLSQGLFTEIVADPKAFLDLLADCGVVQKISSDWYTPIQPEPPHVHKWQPHSAHDIPNDRIALRELCCPCPLAVVDGALIRERTVEWPAE